MSLLKRIAPLRSLHRAFTRVIKFESVPAFDQADHMSNMSTKDIFQFEPFANEDLINFPRERPGKDYDLNWSLASEWFSVWGDAYRNPDRSLLMNHLKCVRDDFNNAYCKRTYKDSVTASSKDFEELSDEVKEFLSKVPNLYVEDAAVASGRFLETRIRSVTNDPVTALALKNMLHRMPLRHPQTPHPLGLIVARGMSQSFTSIGMDPHSRALTVLIGGDVSIHRILQEVEKATEMYFTRERGVIDMPEATVKGPQTKCIVPCSTVITSQGVKLVFGLSPSTLDKLISTQSLFCDTNTILSNLGVSRLFAGCECDATQMQTLENEMIVNEKVYRGIEGDNLLEMPTEVVFVDEKEESRVLTDRKQVEERLKKVVENEENVSFILSKLKNSVVRVIHSDSEVL